MAQVFRDDRRYLDWRKLNPGGFVLNVDDEPGGTVLHRADCSYLTGPIERGQTLTTFDKLCSRSVKELAGEMSRYAGARACSRCEPL